MSNKIAEIESVSTVGSPVNNVNIERLCSVIVFIDEVMAALASVVPDAAETFHVGHAYMIVSLMRALEHNPTPYRLYSYNRSGARHIIRYWDAGIIRTLVVEVV